MTNKPKYQKYEGKALEEYQPGFGLDAYIPSEELIQAVEAARLLGRPLLLRGEPGSGKTRLAEAVAVELHGAAYRDFYFPWPIKSTTKAQDGLYRFDHLERMQEVYAAKERPGHAAAEGNLMRYVKLGPIGKAFERMMENEEPSLQGGCEKVELRLEGVLKHFEETRKKLRDNPNASKIPSTSELLDWARILAIYLGRKGWSVDEQMNLVQDDKIRIRPEQILLKNRDDERLVRNT